MAEAGRVETSVVAVPTADSIGDILGDHEDPAVLSPAAPIVSPSGGVFAAARRLSSAFTSADAAAAAAAAFFQGKGDSGSSSPAAGRRGSATSAVSESQPAAGGEASTPTRRASSFAALQLSRKKLRNPVSYTRPDASTGGATQRWRGSVVHGHSTGRGDITAATVDDLSALQPESIFAPEFFAHAELAVAYYLGDPPVGLDWEQARWHADQALLLRPADGPLLNIVAFMDSVGVGPTKSAPSDWKGFRVLDAK